MKWYVWLCIIIVVWYIAYYYYPPRNVAILQTSLSEFTFDLLLQRQPIVLSESVTDWSSIKDAWFPSNRVDMYQESIRDETSDTWRRNRYKYLLLQPYADTELILYPANKRMTSENVPPENEKLLAIKCKPYQIVILPYRWHFYIPKDVTYGWMGIHDWITRFLP